MVRFANGWAFRLSQPMQKSAALRIFIFGVGGMHLGLQKRPGLLQSLGTPKPQKCMLKSEKCHFRRPEKMAPKSQSKCPKSPFSGNLNVPKRASVTFSLSFGAISPGGPKWHFSDFRMRFWGFGVPGLCSRPESWPDHRFGC